MRSFIFGDIHGCNETLHKAIREAAPVPGDRLIFVGDYFDRGPDSAGVFHYLQELKEKFGDDLILIRGNHEVMLTDYHKGLDDNWLNNGYAVTLRSFRKDGLDIRQVIRWIDQETHLFFADEKYNICHAGTYFDNISENDMDTLIWDRDALEEGLYHGKLTIVGHTPDEGGPRYSINGDCSYFEYDTVYDLPENGIICIDTWCVGHETYGSPNAKLTYMEITDDKMIFHSV